MFSWVNESASSRFKVKMTKFEGLMNTWDAFQSNLRHLKLLFAKYDDKHISSSLEVSCLFLRLLLLLPN